MRITKLELENFGSHKNSLLEFTVDSPITIITGNTGAGKSTILDAITFAFFERIPRYSDKETKRVISYYQLEIPKTSSKVILEFESNGNLYRIRREINIHNGETSYSSFLSQIIENEEVKKGSKKSEVDRMIKDLVGIDYDVFSRTVILPQGKFADFLKTDRPDKRREIINEIFKDDLNIYSEIQEFIRTKIREMEEKINLKIRDIESNKQTIANALKEIQSVINHENSEEILKNLGNGLDTEQKWKDFKNFLEKFSISILDKLENEIKLLQHRKETTEQDLSKVREKKKSFEGAQKVISQMEETEKVLSEKFKEFEQKSELLEIDIKEHLSKNQFSTIKEILKNNTTLSDKALQEINEISIKLSQLKNEYEKLKKIVIDSQELLNRYGAKKLDDLKIKIDIKNEELKELSKKIDLSKENEIDNKIKLLSQILLQIDQLSRIDRSILESQKLIQNLEDKKYHLNSKLETYNSNLEGLKKEEVKYYSSLIIEFLNEGDTCPICGGKITEKHKSHTDETILAKRKSIENELENIKKEISKIEGQIQELKSNIEKQNSYKNDISKGLDTEYLEKPLDQIKNELDSLEKEKSTIIQNRKKLEEIKEILHKMEIDMSILNEKKKILEEGKNLIVKELVSELIKLKKHFEVQDLLINKIENEKKLSEFFDEETWNIIQENLSKEKITLEKKRNMLNYLESELIPLIQSKIEMKEIFREQLKSMGVNLEDISYLKDKFIQIDKEIEEKEKYKKSIELEISQKMEISGKVKTILSNSINLVDLSLRYINELDKMEKEKKIFDNLESKFKTEELINFIIKSKMDELTEVANEFVYRLGINDKRLDVDFSTKDLKFNIKYSDGISNLADSLSGGESFVFSIALAFAVSNEVIENKNIKSIFIDEGFDTLDSDFNDRVFRFLTQFAEDKNINIYLITHKEDLAKDDKFPKILVEKKNNVSVIRRIT